MEKIRLLLSSHSDFLLQSADSAPKRPRGHSKFPKPRRYWRAAVCCANELKKNCDFLLYKRDVGKGHDFLPSNHDFFKKSLYLSGDNIASFKKPRFYDIIVISATLPTSIDFSTWY